MIFDRDTATANWLTLNKLSKELAFLKYNFLDDVLLHRHISIALGELERDKETLGKRIEENAEITKIKRDFEK